MIGTLLSNRYELLKKIGEGGMGIVYKAKCSLLNRFVAVKILKAEFNNCEDFMARFKREANSIASLSHPNIVNIYDVGSDNNINFIVMEYINGKTLKQIIKESVQFSTLKTLDIALQIAKALECAHKNNIIHRDIKPDNILITDNNTAKLTDFGIAKVTDSITLTNPNKIIGSIHYLSPEQAKGTLVDLRADIYALGVVMYEMITGQVPYNAEIPISIAVMHIQEPITPPKEIITDIPENMNRVILKALEKDPINRFQIAKELADILNAIKKNPNLEVNFNKLIDATVLMERDTVLSDTEIDSTFIMTQILDQKTSMTKKDRDTLSINKGIINNKKIILTIGLIISAIIIGVSWKYSSKSSSTATEIPTAETIVPLVSITSPNNEKKLVPSLIGNTQYVAENIIVNNGFLLGNITNEYSDTIPNGLIVSQSPAADTYYESTGKIDLVISQGQKVTPAIEQTIEDEEEEDDDNEKDSKTKKGNDKSNGKNNDKKKKNN